MEKSRKFEMYCSGANILVVVLILFCLTMTGHAADTNKLLMLSNNAFSGKAAPWGLSQDRGMKMAAEEVNAAGGIKIGTQTYMWEVISYDNRYIPAESVSVMKRGLAAGCKYMAVLGGAVTQPLIPMINENKVITLAAIAGGADFTNVNNPYLFRTMPSSDLLLSIEGIKVYKRLKVKRIASIMADNVLGRSDGKTLKNALKLEKMSDVLVAEEYVNTHTSDFTPVLTRVLVKKPDHIEGGAWPASSLGLLCKQARELGFKGSISNMTGAPEIEALVETGGKQNVEGLILARVWPPDQMPTEKFREFWDRYVARYKETPGANTTEGHAAFKFLSGAINKAQTLDADQIVKVMRDFQQGTILGEVKLIGKNNPLLLGYGINNQFSPQIPITQVKDGKVVVVKID